MFFLYFILLFSLISVLNCNHTFLMIHKFENGNYYCVTNSSHAITWIHENSTLNKGSVFLPDFQQHNYFDFNDKKYKNNGVYNESAMILDRRWEELKILTTTYAKGNEALNFVNPKISIPHDNFRVSFSVRIEKEAHIFLCDGENVPQSNCYWLLLEAFNGNKTVVRKCKREEIRSINDMPALGSCTKNLIERPSNRLFSSRMWKHFVLIKRNNVLFLFDKSAKNGILVLSFEDVLGPIKISNLFIHSKRVSGFWKFHYAAPNIYINEEINLVQLWPILDTSGGSVCVSLFVIMCPHCNLTLTLREADNPVNSVLKEQVYVSNAEFYSGEASDALAEWKEIKFVENDIESDKVSLLISTSADKITGAFWAIDAARVCQSDESRIITSSEKADCQLLSNDGSEIFIWDDNMETLNRSSSNMDINCPEYTFQGYWVHYLKDFFQNWGRTKICEKYETKVECRCSAGHYGNNCYPCTKPCAQCSSGFCNSRDETCGPCMGNYSGRKCNIPPATILLAAPNVTDIQHTSISLRVDNFTVVNITNHDQPEDFTVEYKNVKGQAWTEVWEKRYKLEYTVSPKIYNLKPDTTYLVRFVITTQLGHKHVDDRIPFSKFRTLKCDGLIESNLRVELLNTSATLVIPDLVLQKSNRLCTFETYKTEINSTAGKNHTHITPSKIVFDELTPFTNYKIKLHNRFSVLEKDFLTTEGVPGTIENLNLVSISSDSISLKWNPPAHLYGHLKHYTVKYRHLSYIECAKGVKNQISVRNVTINSITLSDLKPFSHYSVSISVNNPKWEGHPVTVSNTTLGASEILEEEIPEIEQIIPDSVSVQIKFSEFNCNKMRGFLWIHSTVSCSHRWCSNSTTQRFNYTFNNTLQLLNGLLPFSNYTVKIQFCRNEILCNEIVKIGTFTTRPGNPNQVKDLLVYRKNQSSISLRWRAPYPPTGVVKLYKIEYKICRNNDLRKLQNVADSFCKMWPDYQCCTIDRLEENQIYCVKVSAVNKNSENCGSGALIEANTTVEPSKIPYDLTIDWSLDNDLNLAWKHPNESNGDIEHFNIMLEPSHPRNLSYMLCSILVVAPDEYTLVYRYKIKAERILPSTKYKIRIVANNGHLGEELIGRSLSPPSIPLFATEPKIHASNTAIDIEIVHNITDQRTESIYELFLFISDDGFLGPSHAELQKFENCFNLTLSKFRLLCNCSLEETALQFTVGSETNNCSRNASNHPLTPATIYNVTILLTNTFNNLSRYKLYSFEATTAGEDIVFSCLGLFIWVVITLLSIAVVAVIAWLVYKVTMNQSFREQLTSKMLDQEIPLVHCDERNCNMDLKDNTYSKEIINVSNFEEYVKMSLENGNLVTQHETIVQNAIKLVDVNNLFWHYIGVHFSSGDKITKAYLATEMPTPKKVNQFWKLVWDKNVQNIVLFSNEQTDQQEFTTPYWPKKQETLRCNNIFIKLTSCKAFADYEQREFTVNNKKERRRVNQFCFLSWLENDIPNSAFIFVPFFKKLLKTPLDSNSPILVHSSSGVSGAGFALLCDICLRIAEKDHFVNIFYNSQMLANCFGISNNSKHYLLAHLVILECLIALDRGATCKSRDLETLIPVDIQHITQFFNYMNETVWIDDTIKRLKREAYLTNEDHQYAYIDAINSSTVVGLTNQKLMVAQQPTRFSVEHFWKAVEKNDVDIIVSLNETLRSSENYLWWPNQHQPRMNFSEMNIKCKNIVKFDNYVCTTLDLEGKVKRKTVKMFSIIDWPAKRNFPLEMSEFVDFCIESSRKLKNSYSVMVACNDGVTASGLYVAMLYNIERMEMEEFCDVYATARITRNSHQGFLKEKEQLAFLWKATEKYLNKKVHSAMNE